MLRLLLALVLVVLVSACSGTSEPSRQGGGQATGGSPTEAPAAGSPGEEGSSEPSPESSEAAATDAPQGGEPISLTGKGSRKTKPFVMASPAKVDLTFNGSGNFISRIVPVGGSALDGISLSNTIGKVKLTTYVYEADLDGVRSYVDTIATTGTWTVRITPGSPAATNAPATFKGKWGLRTSPVTLSGDYTVTFSHRGSGNFIVYLVPVDGGLFDGESISNEIGKVDDSTEVYGLDGDYYLDVTADGAWEISIAQQ
jgi:hypothetical protein